MSTNVIYTSIPQLLASCTTLLARYNALDLILNNMEIALSNAATTGQFDEYKLDTGQTKTEIRYRSLDSLQKSYDSLLDTQQKILNRINKNRTGSQFRLVSGRNFPGRGYYGRGQ